MTRDVVTRLLLAVAGAAVVGAALTASAQPTSKLDETVFYNGPRFKLKLVRYHETLPLHYVGEVFHVQCASAGTANSPGHRTQDPGWVALGNGGAIGSKSAAELVARERDKYVVLDEHILVVAGPVLSVSFDACRTFHAWNPTTLPGDLIDPVDKPSYCAPTGKLDCRHYDFQGDRTPRYSDIRASARGRVSFLVRSRSFKGNAGLRVLSRDFGRTWTVTPAVEFTTTDPLRAFVRAEYPLGDDYFIQGNGDTYLLRCPLTTAQEPFEGVALSEISIWGNHTGPWEVFRKRPDGTFVYVATKHYADTQCLESCRSKEYLSSGTCAWRAGWPGARP